MALTIARYNPIIWRRYLILQQGFQRIAKKVEDGHAIKEKTEIAKKAVASKSLRCEIGIYLYILFPVVFNFLLSILSGKMKRDDYRTHIDGVFEKIMLDGIDYSGFMDILRKITSSNKNFVYAIGCFLLGTFPNLTEAAKLHFVNLIRLDDTFKKTNKSFYNFQVITFLRIF
ncbi:hypothetical protein [Cyclobacterium sp.]|uniref:hypothetical protein n=1 Tax=Cyclobacterium sp. TaxID=1966343 RepID=UPI00198A6A08|nr:hypothetical protein [Cyclobacterium sp.]MBD3628160.1 hypothetical protein [Cyclobacterium sp.]